MSPSRCPDSLIGVNRPDPRVTARPSPTESDGRHTLAYRKVKVVRKILPAPRTVVLPLTLRYLPVNAVMSSRLPVVTTLPLAEATSNRLSVPEFTSKFTRVVDCPPSALRHQDKSQPLHKSRPRLKSRPSHKRSRRPNLDGNGSNQPTCI